MKAPKQVEVWADLPRSKVGKVLKTDIKARLAARVTRGAGGRRPTCHLSHTAYALLALVGRCNPYEAQGSPVSR